MTTSIPSLFATSFAVSAGIFILVWLISILKKDVSIVDILWGPACAAPGITAYWVAGTGHPQQLLLVTLVSIWALRLSLYLAKRNLPHGEDYRYVRMRKRSKNDTAFIFKSLWYVFGMQLVISWIISLPVQLGAIGLEGNSISSLAYFGAALWLLGFCFETVGDHQLTQFKKNPENAGELMTKGLWAWTRHPNYFGDSMVWTGLTVIALAAPYGIYTIVSPLLMALFLVKVSGKAMTERHMDEKYSEYETYKATTSGFIPMPPK